MELKSVLSTIGTVVVAGLMIQSIVMTSTMKKLDTGMNENLKSTKQLLSVQQEIQEKNNVLNQSLQTTKALNDKFGESVAKAQQIDSLVAQVVAANSQIMQLNQQNVGLTGASGQQLTKIKQTLTQLLESNNTLKNYLSQLKQTTDSDVYWLGEIKKSSDNLNRKMP
ncbi:hypothetical protein [Effusibacillus consociatus]|uniref:Uncharacterized protein n=1 Tax=Effusibacillus consociatus TaxID=1117041 RepID=A0ABV9PY59_9BACL